MLMMCDFPAKSFLFVAAAAYSQLFVSCLINIFSFANYIMLTSLDEYFSTTISVAESCMRGSLFMQFLSITIS